jgi:hypothetical protein
MTEHIPLEDLSAWIDGELPPERRAAVERHLAGCAACRAELESLRWSVAFTAALPRAPLPPGASLRVPMEGRATPAGTGVRRWFGWPRLAFNLAAVAVIVGLIGLLVVVQQRPSSSLMTMRRAAEQPDPLSLPSDARSRPAEPPAAPDEVAQAYPPQSAAANSADDAYPPAASRPSPTTPPELSAGAPAPDIPPESGGAGRDYTEPSPPEPAETVSVAAAAGAMPTALATTTAPPSAPVIPATAPPLTPTPPSVTLAPPSAAGAGYLLAAATAAGLLAAGVWLYRRSRG